VTRSDHYKHALNQIVVQKIFEIIQIVTFLSHLIFIIIIKILNLPRTSVRRPTVSVSPPQESQTHTTINRRRGVCPRSAEPYFGSISSKTRVFPESRRVAEEYQTFVLPNISCVSAFQLPLRVYHRGTLLSYHHAQPCRRRRRRRRRWQGCC
jgi:hypothetical protein